MALLVWIYPLWVNVSGVMHPLDKCPAILREATEFPGFLFSSQVASLKLVETEDLIPLLAPIVWPIFGGVMALKYPTQPLRVAQNAPSLSILHFVNPSDKRRTTNYQSVVCNFANVRPHLAYILRRITCLTKPEMVDKAIHQQCQKLKTSVPLVAREPTVRTLPVSEDVPSNPRMALQIFLELLSRQREHGNPVSESYAKAVQTYRNSFSQYGHQQFANKLPEVTPESLNNELEIAATGSSTS